MDQTNPSEAAAASSPLPDERTLQHIAESRLGYYPEPVQAMAREILRMRHDCPPTAEVEQLRADLKRLRDEKKSEIATAIEHLRKAGVIVGSPTAGPTPGVAIGEPMTLASAVGMLCDERAKILTGLGREAKALLEASFMLRCAAGRHPMPSPRVEETFGIFEALRKLCDERDTAMHEADAWKRKADKLGGDLNRIRSLVPTASDEQTTFDAVQAELARLRQAIEAQSCEMIGAAKLLRDADNLSLPAEAQTAIAAMRDVGPELAKAGIQVGPRCSHAEAVAQLRGERDRWREKFEAADKEAAEAARWGISTGERLMAAGFVLRAPKEAGLHGAVLEALAELARLRKESKRDQVGKQQALLDEIARMLPGKGDLLTRVAKLANFYLDARDADMDRYGFAQLRLIGEDIGAFYDPGIGTRKSVAKLLRAYSDAAYQVERLRFECEATGNRASLPSLPAKGGPLPGSFCGTNQPQMPQLQPKVGPATGQPRTEVPAGTTLVGGDGCKVPLVETDGSGTVVELGEAFRRNLANAVDCLPSEGSYLGAGTIKIAICNLHAAVAELAKVVERIGAR